MTVVCSPPDLGQGVALRLSTFLDCQARALGENGFQAIAGGPMGTALLSAAVTVFIALIGYRLMLGHTPDARDGVGWAVRLGIVLALVTSWPAFQALVYRVAVDAPTHVAAVLLPASGIAGESLDDRVQQSYDTLRLGVTQGKAVVVAGQNPQQAGAAAAATATQPILGEPLPKTASLLVIATSGVSAALRIAIGFLLAVAPLAIVSLLFGGTNGLFIGWVRALAGLALGLIGATVVTAIHLVAVEGELSNLQGAVLAQAGPEVDAQALTTIVLFFAVVTVVTTLAGLLMGSALRFARAHSILQSPPLVTERVEQVLVPQAARSPGEPAAGAPGAPAQARARAVAEVLSTAVHREQRVSAGAAERHIEQARPAAVAAAAERREEYRPVERIGVAGRRSLGRRTLSAARRDKVA